MGVVGFQDYWVTGSRFYFDRDGTTQGQLLDLGVIDTAQPSFEVNKIELQDGDGGRLVTVDSEVTSINENYEITVKNFNTETLSLMFLANEPTALNQTLLGPGGMDTMKVSLHPGHVAKLTSGGEGLYGISAATFQDAAPASLVDYDVSPATADFRWVSKERGIIKFLAGGSLALADGEVITCSAITYDSAIHGATNRRLVYPQSSSGALTGGAYLYYSRKNTTEQSVREFKCSLTPSSAAYSVDDYSTYSMTAQVLSDLTQTSDIAGVMAHIDGDEASVSSIS